MTENIQTERPGYWRYVFATIGLTIMMSLRRKRILLAGCIALAPVVIPLAMAFFSASQFAEQGNETFVKMVQTLYLQAIVPLISLFFGCMLVGEDVEAQTIPYIMTRPMPRSAWIVGKYLAFMIITLSIMIPAVFLLFCSCITLADFSFTTPYIMLMLHYELVIAIALMGYGAFCMFLGALFKRPVIVGVCLLFGWQQLAMRIPGLIRFFTIEKYVREILPKLATERGKETAKRIIATPGKLTIEDIPMDPIKATVMLFIIASVMILITNLIVRWREYSTSRALG